MAVDVCTWLLGAVGKSTAAKTKNALVVSYNEHPFDEAAIRVIRTQALGYVMPDRCRRPVWRGPMHDAGKRSYR